MIEKDGTNIQDSSNMNAFRETTTVRRLEGRGFQVRELGAIGEGKRTEKGIVAQKVRQGWHGCGVLSQQLFFRRATIE